MGFFGININKNIFVAPVSGKLVSLSEVPDPVFSEKMMGDGFAIIPSSNTIVSPVNGSIVNVFPTKHAIGIKSAEGHELLIHVGLDTVNLQGEGFDALVSSGDKVKAGQPILEVNFNKIKTKVPSIITPIVFTDGSNVEILKLDQEVEANEKDIIKIK